MFFFVFFSNNKILPPVYSIICMIKSFSLIVSHILRIFGWEIFLIYSSCSSITKISLSVHYEVFMRFEMKYYPSLIDWTKLISARYYKNYINGNKFKIKDSKIDINLLFINSTKRPVIFFDSLYFYPYISAILGTDNIR